MASISYAQYGVPHQFKGTVTVNGIPAPDSWLVIARIDSKDAAATTVLDGAYGQAPGIFYIEDPLSNREGKVITFVMKTPEKEANAATAVYHNGFVSTLNLAVEGDFCGEGICTSGESCSSCPADCGPCASPSSGGGSSGRGGGGGAAGIPTPIIITDDTSTTSETAPSDASCTPDWVCSDWLDCVGGQMKRICVDSNKCGTDEGRPAETQQCETPKELAMAEAQAEEEDARRSGLTGITGAILGGGTATWVTVIIVAGLLFGLLYINRARLFRP